MAGSVWCAADAVVTGEEKHDIRRADKSSQWTEQTCKV